MFKSIVVGTDGSPTADRAVEAAANLARDFAAQLHVVTAYREASGIGAASGAALAESGVGRALQHDVARLTAEKAVATWAEGLDASVYATSESAPNAILDTARSVGADLIVVGSKGMQGAQRILGSVPNTVAHGADCAVLIVKTDA
ncbi:MAG TPA: universal stress protein [Acidimicrobiales bacterium]|jgi:nucleotide-binding universal stress UspA family protein|nr:universal stress protein [Acidimicrobiales bacterium]